MTKKQVSFIKGEIENDVITINFTPDKTINLDPRKYYWDIVIYKNPEYEEGDEQSKELPPINGEEINSYYAAFSLPICEIKEAVRNV